MAALLIVGCAAEAPEDDTPFPLSPRAEHEGSAQNHAQGPNGKKAAASPNAIVQIPTTTCVVTITRSERATESIQKPGAIIQLESAEGFQDPILIYRISDSLLSRGSFLAVSDMVFGASGTHPTGSYVFELQSTDGQSCKTEISVTDADAQNNQRVLVKATVPQR